MKKNLFYLLAISVAMLIASCTGLEETGDTATNEILTTEYVRDVFYDEVLAQAVLNKSDGILSVGFVVGTEEMPVIENDKVFDAELPGEDKCFTAYVNGLNINTRYCLRSYAINSDGEVIYGGQMIFRTAKTKVEYVKMGKVSVEESGLTAKSLEVTGNVTNLGGASRLYEYGAYYWPKGDESAKVKVSYVIPEEDNIGANTDFTFPISGLAPETEYEVMLYARNLRKEQYADVVTATTLKLETPAVELIEVRNVTASSAIVEGHISSLGNDPEATFGISFGTSDIPDTEVVLDSKESDGNGGFNFISKIRGLKANTPYRFQTWIKNDLAVARSEVSTAYQTLESGMPIVVTPEILLNEGIGVATAYVPGLIESDGGSDLSEFGIEWGRSESELVKAKVAAYDDLTGEYAVKLSELESNTTYYYRAYASNSYGEVKGDLLHFRTGINGGYKWYHDTKSKTLYHSEEALVYFELDPLELEVVNLKNGSTRHAVAYVLDRNLGALAPFPRIDMRADDEIEWSENYVGYFYQWGFKNPSMVYRLSDGKTPETAVLMSSSIWGGTAKNIQDQLGWTKSPATPIMDAWPESNNPCPAGYVVPSNEEWQAIAVAVAKKGTGNGDFQDVYNILRLGKGGYRQAGGNRGTEKIVEGGVPTDAVISNKVLSYIWSSTALRAAGSRIVNVTENILDCNLPAGAPFIIDNTSATNVYHFSISDKSFSFGEVGRTYMMDTNNYLTDPSNKNAFADAKYYDSWMYHGMSDRNPAAGVPVRCVRFEY